jgi:hopene-associated glycosyltransferase HpnB
MRWAEAVAWVPAAIWIYLIVGRGRFWLPTVRLGRRPEPDVWPAIAVIVPARNEAEMLAVTLPQLRAQSYPGPARVILVDDCSIDDTAGVAEQIAAGPGLAVEVVRGAAHPAGWVGKTWALHQGVAAANAGDTPEFLLFTDADISHPPMSVRLLVSAAVAESKDLVSLMARLRTANQWEKLIVPAFVYFFSQLYPFRSVSKDRSRTAAAAGGCVLVRREALDLAGGVEAISGAVIDDVALAQALKRSGASVWLEYADEVRSVRPYPHLSDLWDMVSRSAYTQLRYSPPALVGTMIGLVLTYESWLIVLIVGLTLKSAAICMAGATAWTLLTFSYLPMLAYYRLSPLRAVTLPLTAALYGAMTVDSARRYRRGSGATWKGRTYAANNLSE